MDGHRRGGETSGQAPGGTRMIEMDVGDYDPVKLVDTGGFKGLDD